MKKCDGPTCAKRTIVEVWRLIDDEEAAELIDPKIPFNQDGFAVKEGVLSVHECFLRTKF